MAKRVLWTPEEDAILLSFKGTNKELSDQLGRSVKSIQMRRKRLSASKQVKKEVNNVVTSNEVSGNGVFERSSKKIVDLQLGDVFILPNGNKYIYNSINEPVINRGKLECEFIGENTVRYICIIPENFGYDSLVYRKYTDSELSRLECTFLFNVWDIKVK